MYSVPVECVECPFNVQSSETDEWFCEAREDAPGCAFEGEEVDDCDMCDIYPCIPECEGVHNLSSLIERKGKDVPLQP